MFSQLQLYRPFLKEDELRPDDHEACLALYEEESPSTNRKKIQNIKSLLMKYLGAVEEGIQSAQQNVEHDVGAELDPELAQDNDDCQAAGVSNDPAFQCVNPNLLDNTSAEDRVFRLIEVCDTPTLQAMSRGLDIDQRFVLDAGVDFAKRLVIAKNSKHSTTVNPPLLAIQGGAGSGKSRVIDILCQHVDKILRSPGDNPDHPYVLKVAYTGTAAANIKGCTLHTAFSFKFGNEFLSLADTVKGKKQLLLENLKLLCIDEMSMVPGDMLYQLHLRLKELMQSDKLFGGVAVFMFGDILQLRPVAAVYLYERPQNPTFQIAFKLSPLWNEFKIILLRTNHRQGADREYAEILNRIRTEEMTEEDMAMLRTRVLPANSKDMPEGSLLVTRTNAVVNRLNDEALNKINSPLLVFTAVNKSSRGLVMPRVENTGAIKNTCLQAVLKLKVGSKVMMTYNVSTADMLTNGAFGIVLGFHYEGDKVKYILVKFNNPEVGSERRKNFTAIQAKYPGHHVTPVGIIEQNYSPSKLSKNSPNSMTAVQFPLKVS